MPIFTKGKVMKREVKKILKGIFGFYWSNTKLADQDMVFNKIIHVCDA